MSCKPTKHVDESPKHSLRTVVLRLILSLSLETLRGDEVPFSSFVFALNGNQLVYNPGFLSQVSKKRNLNFCSDVNPHCVVFNVAALSTYTGSSSHSFCQNRAGKCHSAGHARRGKGSPSTEGQWISWCLQAKHGISLTYTTMIHGTDNITHEWHSSLKWLLWATYF